MGKFTTGYLLAILAIFSSSCFFSEETSDENVVLLDELIYLSSNKVRLLGRAVSTTGGIDDHGFYLSTDESFSDPIIKSLGSKKGLGLFLAELDSLQQTTQYFYKAFLTTENSTFFSETAILNTYEGQVSTLTRKEGKAGEITKIIGRNLTNDIQVFFGDTKAEITDRYGDYEVWVEVPVVYDYFKQPVVVKMESQSHVVDTFRYETGKWTHVLDFTGGSFTNVVHFKDEDTFTFGLGIDFNGRPNEDFFSLDLNTLTWSKHPINPNVIPVQGAFSTPGGYFGGGASDVIPVGQALYYVLENSFYRYKDGIVELLPTSAPATFDAYAEEINGTLYVFGGRNNYYLPVTQFYKYHAPDQWTELGEMPFAFDQSMLASRYGDEIVFITNTEQIWEFDSKTESFTFMGEFPLNISTHGFMDLIDQQLVFGLFSLSNLVYSFQYPDTDLLNKLSFPGNRQLTNVAQFTHENDIYILRASVGEKAISMMELWKFEPFEFIN